MTADILYREATTADAAAVADVLVSSWKESFVGVVADSFLNGLTVEAQSERLRNQPSPESGPNAPVPSRQRRSDSKGKIPVE